MLANNAESRAHRPLIPRAGRRAAMLLALAMVVSCVGCAHIPAPPPDLDERVRTLQPSAGKGAIYVLRATYLHGYAVSPPVWVVPGESEATYNVQACSDAGKATLPPGHFTCFDVDPGTYTVVWQPVTHGYFYSDPAHVDFNYTMTAGIRTTLVVAAGQCCFVRTGKLNLLGELVTIDAKEAGDLIADESLVMSDLDRSAFYEPVGRGRPPQCPNLKYMGMMKSLLDAQTWTPSQESNGEFIYRW